MSQQANRNTQQPGQPRQGFRRPTEAHQETKAQTNGHKRTYGHLENMELMRAIGSKDYNPMPSSQHTWQMAKDQPPLLRMWSWMSYHTLHFGHRSPFAVKIVDGHPMEQHIEHMAADLEMDEANCYRTWKQGVERGLWANWPLAGEGDGRNPQKDRRLYLRGNVPKFNGEETVKTVRTDSLPHYPPYIRKQLDAMPSEEKAKALRELAFEDELERRLLADALMVTRAIVDQRKDNVFSAHGVKKIRESHVRKAESPEDRFARESRLDQLRPSFELYVQTVLPLVQTVEITADKPENEFVHPENEPATLLPDRTDEKPKLKAGDHLQAPPRAQASPPSHQGKSVESLPTAKAALSAFDENPEAAQLFSFEIPRMQATYKHTDFGLKDFDAERKTDQILIGRLVILTGSDPNRAMKYLLYVAGKFKGLDRNALGKSPSRSPSDPSGPLGFGLLLEWAKDWAAKNPIGGPQ